MDDFQQQILSNLYKKFIDTESYEPSIHAVNPQYIDETVHQEFSELLKSKIMQYALKGNEEDVEAGQKIFHKFHKHLSLTPTITDVEFVTNIDKIELFIKEGYVRRRKRIQRIPHLQRDQQYKGERYIINKPVLIKKELIRAKQFAHHNYINRLQAHLGFLANYFNERTNKEKITPLKLIESRQKEIITGLDGLYRSLHPEYDEHASVEVDHSLHLEFAKLTKKVGEHTILEKLKNKLQGNNQTIPITSPINKQFYEFTENPSANMLRNKYQITAQTYVSQLENSN